MIVRYLDFVERLEWELIQQEDEGEEFHSNQRTPLRSLGVCVLNTPCIPCEHIPEQVVLPFLFGQQSFL